MTPAETLRVLAAPTRTPAEAFAILQSIARLLGEKPEDPGTQSLLIRALEHREDFARCSPLLNALLRETGLYPYAEPAELSARDRLAFEFHRPQGLLADTGMVFHRVQAQVYWRLIDGENVILSSPTSFGKSFDILKEPAWPISRERRAASSFRDRRSTVHGGGFGRRGRICGRRESCHRADIGLRIVCALDDLALAIG